MRYFVDKFPLFLSPTAVVHFTFVSEGAWPQLEMFRSHLRLYGRLFQARGKVRLVYIHQSPLRISEAETCFHAMLKSGGERQFENQALTRYFELRHAWERKQYQKVGPKELLYLSQSRKKYAAPRYDLLYSEWKFRKEKRAQTRSSEMMTTPSRGNSYHTDQRGFENLYDLPGEVIGGATR